MDTLSREAEAIERITVNLHHKDCDHFNPKSIKYAMAYSLATEGVKDQSTKAEFLQNADFDFQE